MSTWKVDFDGDSLPMIISPAGRVFRLQELKDGKWQAPTDTAIENLLVERINLGNEVIIERRNLMDRETEE
jgi:hypothetical protein